MVVATENYSDYCFFVPFYNLELIIKLGLKIKRESEKRDFEYFTSKKAKFLSKLIWHARIGFPGACDRPDKCI
jgi:hypothetical protein